jgi:hypothetical protein
MSQCIWTAQGEINCLCEENKPTCRPSLHNPLYQSMENKVEEFLAKKCSKRNMCPKKKN